MQMRWYFKYQKWVRIKEVADFSMTEYKFYDENEDEIRLN